jgi:hypothetical protein
MSLINKKNSYKIKEIIIIKFKINIINIINIIKIIKIINPEVIIIKIKIIKTLSK